MATEKRLIDANMLKANFAIIGNSEDLWRVGAIRTAIDNAPTVDAVEVVHGHWENITGGMVALGDCSECKVRQPVIGTNYCKNCGAKMDGDSE